MKLWNFKKIVGLNMGQDGDGRTGLAPPLPFFPPLTGVNQHWNQLHIPLHIHSIRLPSQYWLLLHSCRDIHRVFKKIKMEGVSSQLNPCCFFWVQHTIEKMQGFDCVVAILSLFRPPLWMSQHLYMYIVHTDILLQNNPVIVQIVQKGIRGSKQDCVFYKRENFAS